MKTVKQGDTIRVHYTGRLEDGTVFDSSENRPPLEFTVGEGEVISGLERGVVGMNIGETKIITIPPELGYGHYMKERIFEMDRKKMPGNFNIDVGLRLQMYRADGMPVMVTVIGISENTLTMDANHPLAGKTLIFETKLVEIV
ncbi:peptidyl-prolyl cis-trans isomerase [Dissulfurispira thermophila]|uniref:Peptidyl-prolyl cis-trans isomerase n=2 Tax=root TaxID=1 RepID=A0A7G1GYW7_9BACT|nr:peptidylprolyl isomerase [Dissulfurispira thermophila]BCB95106.1 peptidyl-prolyl cis-trans isomerase [Dissulfurispira thermophila]